MIESTLSIKHEGGCMNYALKSFTVLLVCCSLALCLAGPALGWDNPDSVQDEASASESLDPVPDELASGNEETPAETDPETVDYVPLDEDSGSSGQAGGEVGQDELSYDSEQSDSEPADMDNPDGSDLQPDSDDVPQEETVEPSPAEAPSETAPGEFTDAQYRAYVLGFLLFFTVVIIAYFCYRFLKMFF